MDNLRVRDLMVPLEKFPRIAHSASFYEGLAALEEAQENFLTGKSGQRILLVENKDGKVIGKISPIDLFRGLETNYSRINAEETINRLGMHYIWRSMQKDYGLWEDPFKDLCRKAVNVHIRDFTKPPQEGQIVDANDGLTKCFHLFVMNRHDSLFVQEKGDLVGLLCFSDVFGKVSQTMKSCTVEPAKH